MKTHPYVEKVLIGKDDIAKKVEEMAGVLTEDYKGKNPLFICILKGSVMFYADLTRKIDTELELEFMAISSYGNGTTTSGEVRVIKDLDVSIEGRDVVVVEDIVDTGVTLSYLCKMLKTRGANSVEVACLLSKPARRKADVSVKYVGFEIPDEFVIGYGLDFAEKFRTLEDVCVLKPMAYR